MTNIHLVFDMSSIFYKKTIHRKLSSGVSVSIFLTDHPFSKSSATITLLKQRNSTREEHRIRIRWSTWGNPKETKWGV